jgi:TonB family protein
MLLPRCFPLIFLFFAFSASGAAQPGAPSVRVAVLDFGTTEMGKRAPDILTQSLYAATHLKLIDREESRAAARGAGYAGSLNMTLGEARDLGGAIGCDFYITGDAQVLRRSPSTGEIYYEAYASIFIVSARTGRLALWERPSFNAPSIDAATRSLLEYLKERAAHYAEAIKAARETELEERARALESAPKEAPLIEDAPEDEIAAARENLRLPRPYRRLRPAYPETAARAEAEATVDLQVEIDSSGEVSRVEVVRWAGFGLDEAAVNTVRQLHFTPARRGQTAIPMRVLLRYNFRRPEK